MAIQPAEPETIDELTRGLVPREGQHTSLPLRPRHGCDLPCGWEWRDINGEVMAVAPSYESAHGESVFLRFESGRLGLYALGHVPLEIVAAILAAAPTKIPNAASDGQDDEDHEEEIRLH